MIKEPSFHKYSFEEVTKLQHGDVVFECEGGLNTVIVVVSTPKVEMSESLGKRQVSFIGEVEGSQSEWLLTDGFMHYGPKLYSSPQYTF